MSGLSPHVVPLLLRFHLFRLFLFWDCFLAYSSLGAGLLPCGPAPSVCFGLLASSAFLTPYSIGYMYPCLPGRLPKHGDSLAGPRHFLKCLALLPKHNQTNQMFGQTWPKTLISFIQDSSESPQLWLWVVYYGLNMCLHSIS